MANKTIKTNNKHKVMRTFAICVGVFTIGFIQPEMKIYEGIVMFIFGAIFIGVGLYDED